MLTDTRPLESIFDPHCAQCGEDIGLDQFSQCGEGFWWLFGELGKGGEWGWGWGSSGRGGSGSSSSSLLDGCSLNNIIRLAIQELLGGKDGDIAIEFGNRGGVGFGGLGGFGRVL